MRARNSPAASAPYDGSYESLTSGSPQQQKHKRQAYYSLNQIVLCLIIIAQFIYILMPDVVSMKLRSNSKHTIHKVNVPSYLLPEFHPAEKESEGLVSRKWYSNGSPSINPDLKKGSCWCSADDYCMCTPSVAIDTILTSGPEHFWLVKRKDAGKYATMGGFVEVGETSAEAVRRELLEEMNIDLNSFASTSSSLSGLSKRAKKNEHKGAVLEGVYADPMRDHRRHTVSIVYSVEIPKGVEPKAGDDAAEVVRVHHNEIVDLDFFADHKTILLDYIARHGSDPKNKDDDAPSIKRDLCVQVD